QQHETIWLKNERTIQTFDQRFFPHQIVIEDLTKLEHFEIAIKDMHVRGAPLIGVTAAYGLYIAALEALEQPDFDLYFMNAVKRLRKTRPTAVDLFHALEKVVTTVHTTTDLQKKPELALEAAKILAEES